MTLAYRVHLTPDDNGTLLVTCPALPEVVTFGDDAADALRHARGAIEEALAARIDNGKRIPPGDVDGEHLVRVGKVTARWVEKHWLARFSRR